MTSRTARRARELSLEELTRLGEPLVTEKSAERVVVQQQPELPQLEVWQCFGSYRKWRACFPSFAFTAIRAPVRGGTIRYRGRTRVGRFPDLLAGAPGEPIVCTELSVADQVVAGWGICMFLVEPRYLLEDVLGLRGGAPLELRGSLTCPRASQAFYEAAASYEAEPREPLLQEERLRRFLRAVALATGHVPVPVRGCERSVRAIREYVHAHFDQPLSLSTLAEAVGGSKWHLERSFGARMGLPIGEYARHVRAHRARTLLLQGSSPSAAANVCGYCDQAHMTREFRKLFGFTPGQYRGQKRRSPARE